jgi:hypothetical protein
MNMLNSVGQTEKVALEQYSIDFYWLYPFLAQSYFHFVQKIQIKIY